MRFSQLLIANLLGLSTTTTYAESLRNSENKDDEIRKYDVRHIAGREIKLIKGMHSHKKDGVQSHPKQDSSRALEDAEEVDIIVIGAGFAGLGAARLLQDAGEEVVLLEARNEIGGRSRTVSTDDYAVPFDIGAMWLDYKNDFQPFRFLQNPINQLAVDIDAENVKFPDNAPKGTYEGGTGYDAIRGETFDMDSTTAKHAEEFIDQLAYLKETMKSESTMEDVADKFVENNGLTDKDADYAKFQIVQGLGENYYGGPYDLMSFDYFYEDCDFNGYDDGSYVFPLGHSPLTAALAEGYGDAKGELDIRLGDPVVSIAYDGDSVTVKTYNATYTGSKAIVAVPLGVLKAGSIEFSPELPDSKQGAINRLEMGYLEKVVMVFEEKWWEGAGVMYMSFNDTDIPYFDGFDIIHDPPTLFGFYGGKRVTLLNDQLSDEELVMKCLDQLAEALDMVIPTPIETYVSHWYTDEFAYGSYSYVPVGASNDDMIEIGQQVDNLYFAGEHTNSLFYGQTHGAIMSGRREARKILRQSNGLYSSIFSRIGFHL